MIHSVYTTRIIKRDPNTDTDLDEWTGPPGPAMRGILGGWFKSPLNNFVPYLIVMHAPSARWARSKITKDGRQYRVAIGGGMLRLEAAEKAMKDQLAAQWRAICEHRI